MAKKIIRSITILGREHTYSNSTYFSMLILVNGKPWRSEKPQYGNGTQYEHEANSLLHEGGVIKNPLSSNNHRTPLWLFCRDNGIELYCTMVEAKRKDSYNDDYWER